MLTIQVALPINEHREEKNKLKEKGILRERKKKSAFDNHVKLSSVGDGKFRRKRSMWLEFKQLPSSLSNSLKMNCEFLVDYY